MTPRFLKDDKAFECLRMDDADGYAAATATREIVDLSDADLRGVDLRKVDISKVVLTGAYLRDTDLRGLDLRQHDLEGCTLRDAKLSGTWLPDDLSAEEIRLSHELGTRVRKKS